MVGTMSPTPHFHLHADDVSKGAAGADTVWDLRHRMFSQGVALRAASGLRMAGSGFLFRVDSRSLFHVWAETQDSRCLDSELSFS